MSGHSKWANIKHKKAKADAMRGRVFTRVAREIIVAARQGGGDPEANFRLRMAIQKARDVNMPNESIVRAIKRGTGEGGEGSNYEELTYEGYGPGGVAVLLDVMTDNKNRTASDIRYIFSKHGGNLGEAGCVAWMFEKRGLITMNRSDTSLSEDDLMNYAVEAGAEDFKADEETVEIITNYEDLESVREFLASKGLKLATAEVTMVPKTTIPVSGKEARQVLELVESLEDHDDVQQVYANFDIPEELMEQLAEA
ncbi:MAG: YebC/PmpR family DNA-binding transcriptional regulator [Firmicutes bacterium]|nr:YebC/PmpR family DNA-binding transcriptional regulator [Bacillota bacterium]